MTTDALRPSAAAAAEAWAARVRANREQVERFREVADPPDFYGPVTAMFVADPRRTDEPLLDRLLDLTRPEDTWLDIGAGAGRYALPLALRVREVVAVEPSAGMTAALREGMAAHSIENIRIVEGGWPPDRPTTGAPIAVAPRADVAFIANVGYDIEPIGAFLDAMEASARRLCAAVLTERQPSSIADPFWPIVHGEPRVALPALREFDVLLAARGSSFEQRLGNRPPRDFPDRDALATLVRRQLWIEPGGRKDRIFLRALDDRLEAREGGVGLVDQAGMRIGLVSWRPPSVS